MAKIVYGVDAPKVIRNLALIGLFLILGANSLQYLPVNGATDTLRWTMLCTAIILVGEAALMLLYAKHGKFKHRDRILKQYDWKGDETVLDVGTGHGLLMIGAAKKLTTGKAIGIDIWNKADLSNNTVDMAKINVQLEGVSDKVEIKNENIMSTSFPDNYFDVVVSNLCLHNIKDKAGRQKACREIYRILKPKGAAIISDFKNDKEYREEFEKSGMVTGKMGTYYFDTFPPLTIIKAVKV